MFGIYHEISQQKEELWTSRNFVYNLMKKGKDVSKSIGIFRSKVNRFLKKFKNQVSEDERNFWEERLKITVLAVEAFNKKAKSLVAHEVKKGVIENKTAAQNVRSTVAMTGVGDIDSIPPPYGLVSFGINCGKLFKLTWHKIRQGTVLVVKKMAVRVQNSVSNAVTV